MSSQKKTTTMAAVATSDYGTRGLESLPSSLLVHEVLPKLDLESLCCLSCVSTALRSSVAKALSSLPSLHLYDFSPDVQTARSILSKCTSVTCLTLNCMRLGRRLIEGCLGLHISELNLLCCFMALDSFVAIGEKCPNLRVLTIEVAGYFDFIELREKQMLSSCTHLESLCIKLRGIEHPDYALPFAGWFWPTTLKFLKLEPTLNSDMISLVMEITGRPKMSGLHSLPSASLLQSLSIHVNYISDALVITIAECIPRLLELELEDKPCADLPVDSDLSNIGIQSLCACNHLKTISLSRSRQNYQASFKRVNDMGIFLLSEGCKDLESVRLCGFSKVSDAGFASILHSCSNLKKFEVRSSPFLSDLTFHNLTEAPCSLTELKLLSCNLITSETLKKLALSSNLQVLDLAGCRSVADSSFHSISSLKRLSTLDLAGADITDSALSTLGQGSCPIERLSLRSCTRVTDKGISMLLHSGGILRNTLAALDLGFMPHISDKAVHAITVAGLSITELCIRSCFYVTDSSIQALARKENLETGSRPVRKLDVFRCSGLSTKLLHLLRKPLFRGLHWVGVGCTRLFYEAEHSISVLQMERPWLTVCTNGCEMGCRVGWWEYH